MKKPEPNEVYMKFRELETKYGGRRVQLESYNEYFHGNHWEEAPEEAEFQLVFNYCRTIVLKYAALLARAPRFRIPLGQTDVAQRIAADKREKVLRALWTDLSKAWLDVEMNASKKKYGVLQVLWAPEPGQPKPVTIQDITTTRYTESPFKFRSIKPECFYPVYRTYDDPDDFLYVIRHDPARLVEDLEEQYDVELQATDEEPATVGTAELIEYWDDKHYILVAVTKRVWSDSRGHLNEEESVTVLKDQDHKYGRPPFFVLQNIRNPDEDPTEGGSLGDIDAVIGINKHFNRMVSEAAEEIIVNIHRPVVYASEDHRQVPSELAFTPGAVYPIGAEETLETLQWAGMPAAVDSHLVTLIQGIQDLSFIGQAGFGQYPAGATGVGLKLVLQSLEQILLLKIPLRQACLQSIAKFLFRIFEARTAGAGGPNALQLWVQDQFGRFGQTLLTRDDISGDYFVDIDYGNLLPRNEVEHQQNEVYKFKTDVQTLRTTMDNIGIESPEDEIQKLKEEWQDPILHPDKVMAQMQLKAVQQPQAPPAGSETPTRPVQPGPSMNAAPPVPAQPEVPGMSAPYMDRAPGPNFGQGMPGPGINTGEPTRGR